MKDACNNMYRSCSAFIFLLSLSSFIQIRDAAAEKKSAEHPRSTNELLASLAVAEQLAEEVMMDRHQASDL